MKKKPTHVFFEIVSGVEGSCLVICGEKDKGGFRLAGPKPWGGGRTTKSFRVDFDELIEKAKEHRTSDK